MTTFKVYLFLVTENGKQYVNFGGKAYEKGLSIDGRRGLRDCNEFYKSLFVIINIVKTLVRGFHCKVALQE